MNYKPTNTLPLRICVVGYSVTHSVRHRWMAGLTSQLLPSPSTAAWLRNILVVRSYRDSRTIMIVWQCNVKQPDHGPEWSISVSIGPAVSSLFGREQYGVVGRRIEATFSYLWQVERGFKWMEALGCDTALHWYPETCSRSLISKPGSSRSRRSRSMVATSKLLVSSVFIGGWRLVGWKGDLRSQVGVVHIGQS